MKTSLARVVGVVALSALAGCPDDLPSASELAFSCRDDSDCVAAICIDGTCAGGGSLRDDAGAVRPDAGDDDDDAGHGGDAGPTDAGRTDGGPNDGGPNDGGPSDGGPSDGGPSDGGPSDGGPSDGGIGDGGVGDGGVGDGGIVDGGIVDSGAIADGGADAGVPEPDAGFPDAGLPDAGLPPCPGTPLAPPCDDADPDLGLCLTFDADSADDGSQYGTDGVVTNASYVDVDGGRAIALSGSSGISIADGPGTDGTAGFTAMAWIRLHGFPATDERMGIVDDQNQYGFFVIDTGEGRCSTPSGNVYTPALALDVWTHVACSWDGTSGRMYVDGALFDEAVADAGTLNVRHDAGVGVGMDSPSGDVLNGDLDDVRIYGRGITDDEACWAVQP